MTSKADYTRYEYRKEGDNVTLYRMHFSGGDLVGLDTPKKEQVVFSESGELGLLFEFDPEDVTKSILWAHGKSNEVESVYQEISEPMLPDSKENTHLVLLKGRFSVTELNRMLNIEGYVGTWYSTLIPITQNSRQKNKKKELSRL